MSADLYLNHTQFEAAKLVQIILSEPACRDLNLRCTELYLCLFTRGAIVTFTGLDPTTDLSPETSSIYKTLQERYQSCQERIFSHLYTLSKPRVNSVLLIDDVIMLLMGSVDEIPLPDKYKAIITKGNSFVTKDNYIKTSLYIDNDWTAILKKMVSILRYENKDVMDDLITFVQNELDKVTCCMCLENERDVVFESCKMCCVCHDCVEKIDPKKCPLCRKQFTDYDIIPLLDWNKKPDRGEFKYTGSCINDVYSLLASLQTHA